MWTGLIISGIYMYSMFMCMGEFRSLLRNCWAPWNWWWLGGKMAGWVFLPWHVPCNLFCGSHLFIIILAFKTSFFFYFEKCSLLHIDNVEMPFPWFEGIVNFGLCGCWLWGEKPPNLNGIDYKGNEKQYGSQSFLGRERLSRSLLLDGVICRM